MSDPGINVDFTPEDEGPHPPADDRIWQESVLLHWYDRQQGIGGWHRIGHEPNHNGGKAAIWSYLFDRAGWQYRRCGEVALRAEDRPADGMVAGDALGFSFADQTATWQVTDGPLKATIHCRNLFSPIDPFPRGNDLAAKRFANHFEVAGTVEGTVKYEGRTVEVSGNGYRDHSWGPRNWEVGMLNHRWFTGTLGDTLSFAAITAQAQSGKLVKVGYIRRDGVIIKADEVDVVARIEPDGLTHRGGDIRLTLPGGEKIHIQCHARAAVVFQRGTVVMVEHICDAEGHGLQGYCDAEISSNPRNGAGPVLLALNAATDDGFSSFTPLNLP